jgi:hypothetical protein
MQEIENIKKALEGHTAGKGQHCGVKAGDVVAAGKLIKNPDELSAATIKGSTGERPDKVVYPTVDGLLRLLEQAEG